MEQRETYNPAFGRFVKDRRGSERQIAFASRIGISLSYLSRIETGLIPPIERIRTMAEAVGDDPAIWLAVAEGSLPVPAEKPTSEVGEPYVPVPSNAYLPVLGVLRASEVEMAEEVRGEIFPCLAEHAAQADYVVRVIGSSMYPDVKPGEYIAIKKGAVPVPGDIVVAERESTTYIKRFIRKTREGTLLRSDNPEFEDLLGKDIRIVGVVVWKHTPPEALRRKV